jgi:hypothetical protein
MRGIFSNQPTQPKEIELKNVSDFSTPHELRKKISDIEARKNSIMRLLESFQIGIQDLKKYHQFEICSLLTMFSYMVNSNKLQNLINENLDPALEKIKADLAKSERHLEALTTAKEEALFAFNC